MTKDHKVNQVTQDLMAIQGSQDFQEDQDPKEPMVHRVHQDQWDPRDPRGPPDLKAVLVRMDLGVMQETLGRRELKDPMEMLDQRDRLVSKGNKDPRDSRERREIKDKRFFICHRSSTT